MLNNCELKVQSLKVQYKTNEHIKILKSTIVLKFKVQRLYSNLKYNDCRRINELNIKSIFDLKIQRVLTNK